MPSVTIRRAVAADAEALPAIEQSAGELFRTLSDLGWIADEPNLDVARYREIIAGGWCWVAATPSGEPLGFLAAEVAGDELHLCELGVVQAQQGRGIGRALLRTAIEAARPAGLRALTLTTFRTPPWNAPFYERLGFATLAEPQLSDRLRALLSEEVTRGLPAQLRCAMRLAIGA